MAPISGKPFLEYLIERLAEDRFRQIILMTGYKESLVRAYFGDGSRLGVEIEYSSEVTPLGTGGAVLQAVDSFCSPAEDVLVLNGDSYFDMPLGYFGRFHRENRRPITIALKHMERADRYGTVSLKAGVVEAFNEKSPGKSGGIINAGIYAINTEVLNRLRFADVFSLETDFFPALASRHLISGVLFPGKFIDIGIPDDYNRADLELKEWLHQPKKSALFLDRDGIINTDTGYVTDLSRLELVDGVVDFLRAARGLGFELVVVTNQAGIARGKFSEEEYGSFMRGLLGRLNAEGIEILDTFYCPFHPQATIEKYRRESFDRKPSPGMVLKAAERHSIDLLSSWMIGDKESDRIELPYLRTLLLRGKYPVQQASTVFDSFDGILRTLAHG